MLTAAGRTLHPGCFVCARCKASLDGAKYFTDVAGVICTSCYGAVHRVMCGRCSCDIDVVREATTMVKYVSM